MRPALARALLGCARHPSAGRLVAFLLGRFGPWLRGAEATRDFLVFRHPVPSAEHHVLIVPRRRCPSLETLDAAGFAEAIVLGRAGAARLGDPRFESHALGINGRAFQDVKQAHFHLTGRAESSADSAAEHRPAAAEGPPRGGRPEDAGGRGHAADCRAGAEGALRFRGPRAALRAGLPGTLDAVCPGAPPMPDGAPAIAAAVLETVQAFLAERGDHVHAYRLDFGRPPCGCAEASWFRLRVVEPAAARE